MQSRARFNISSVIDDFSAVNNSILVNDGDKTILGTAIPYLYNLYSDLIVNPSTVSVSEFQKMESTQPVIANALTTIRNLVKNEINKYQHINQKYADFVNAMIKDMDRSLDELIDDMLTALWAGYYVGEKKYITDGRYYYIKDVQPRPPQSIIFRVDSQGKLKEDGIVQYYFNNLWTGYGNLLAFNGLTPDGRQRPNPYASIGDFDYPWRTVWAQPVGTVIIPKSKCVHFTYKGLDGMWSPYGKSLLRAAYDSYLVRAEMTRITRNAANFKASEVPIIVTSPDAANTDDGQIYMDNIAHTLRTLGNDGGDNPFVLLQGKLGESIWIEHMDSTANLEHIIATNKYFDNQMLLACLFQSDLMGMSDKGSYALGKTQQDLVGRNINAIVNSVKSCLIQQVIKPILEVNFNENNDFGTFEKQDNVNEDISLNLEIITTLRNQGIKLTTEAMMAMCDLDMDAVESTDNPIIDNDSMDKDAKTEKNYRQKKVAE